MSPLPAHLAALLTPTKTALLAEFTALKNTFSIAREAAIITRFGALRQTLDDTILIVAREVREAQATQSAKDAAMDGFDHFFSIGADVTGSLLRLGGMPEQAAKLCPSTRRPGHTGADEETPEPAATPPANG